MYLFSISLTSDSCFALEQTDWTLWEMLNVVGYQNRNFDTAQMGVLLGTNQCSSDIGGAIKKRQLCMF